MINKLGMKYLRGLLRLTNYNEECQLLIKQSMVVKDVKKSSNCFLT